MCINRKHYTHNQSGAQAHAAEGGAVKRFRRPKLGNAALAYTPARAGHEHTDVMTDVLDTLAAWIDHVI